VLFQSVREPDARRHFAYMGEGIERLTGLTAAQLLADFGAFYRLIDPKTSCLQGVGGSFLPHAGDGGNAVSHPPHRRRVALIRLSATPRRLGEDRVIWDGLLTDITGQIRAEAAARAYETQLAAVLRHLPGAVARWGWAWRSSTSTRPRPSGWIPKSIRSSESACPRSSPRRLVGAHGTVVSRARHPWRNGGV
jgi:hypothetical protein